MKILSMDEIFICLNHPWIKESSIVQILDGFLSMDYITPSMFGIFISQIFGENDAYNFHQKSD